MEMKDAPSAQRSGQSRKYNSSLMKGVWNSLKDDPDDNLDVRFFDFSEALDSPTSNKEEVDLLILLGP